MITAIQRCRICGNTELKSILNLGSQALTGIFPKSRTEQVEQMPLELVKCVGSAECCGLVQLRHSIELSKLYGDNYGYRSGLNASMVAHLQSKVKRILATGVLQKGDLVID